MSKFLLVAQPPDVVGRGEDLSLLDGAWVGLNVVAAPEKPRSQGCPVPDVPVREKVAILDYTIYFVWYFLFG